MAWYAIGGGLIVWNGSEESRRVTSSHLPAPR